MLTCALRRALCAAVLPGIVVVSTERRAAAQTTTQFPVQFDFLTPGARSMALGGAYIGAADDATAAFTNPGGLAFFGQRQISFELRFRRLDTPYLAGGRISGAPTGIGEDTIATAVRATDSDTHVQPSFGAVVLPIPAKSVSLAFYAHDLVDLRNSFFSRGPFERVTFFGITDDRNREIPIGGTRSVRIATYGGTIAYAWKRLGLGGGVSVSTFDLESDFRRFGFVSSIFGQPDVSLISATTTQRGSDAAVSGNVGALWRAHDRLSVGTAFRRGPTFSFTQHDQVVGALDLTRDGRFKVPDTWAVGVNWSGIPHTRVMVDYDRVQYSQLKRDFIDIQAIASGRQAQLQIDDANEVHGGVEHRRRWRDRDLIVRGGGWWDPDHAVRYVATASHDEVDTLLSATLPGATSVVHYTFGGAMTLGRVVLDAAADLSSQSTSVTSSLLLRF